MLTTLWKAAISTAALLLVAGPAPAAAQPATPASQAVRQGTENAATAPRFVSLKADRVNVRRGPGHDHGIDWVYRRAGLPVEIIASSDIWRRIRDSEGATGWVLASLLSSRRTALVLPWEIKPGAPTPSIPLKSDARESAAAVAQIEAGVIANVRWCDSRWCYIGVAGLAGYIEQPRLWGVYKGEVIR
jgi:SH3-like domain-containing protein